MKRSDGAGVISTVGSHVIGVSVGDKTVLIPDTSCGSCELCLGGNDNLCRHYGIMDESGNGNDCEYFTVPAANLLPLLRGMDFTEAAAMPLEFQIAKHMLVTRAQIRPWETVLVHTAGSGVGSAAIQITTFSGCRVFTTARSDEKLELARKLGDEVAINYKKENFAAIVQAETGNAEVDVFFEHVGGEVWDKSLRSL
jgi:NADPH:quinone reductase-like Zn-dependent oxidoreductase